MSVLGLESGYTVSVLGQEEGYTVKYGLTPRDCPVVQPEGNPGGPGPGGPGPGGQGLY